MSDTKSSKVRERERLKEGGEVEMYKIINRYLASGISSLIHISDEHGWISYVRKRMQEKNRFRIISSYLITMT